MKTIRWVARLAGALAIGVAAIGSAGRVSAAAEPSPVDPNPHAATGAAAHADDTTHPALSDDSTWAGSVVIVIVGMFVAAAVIGPIVRANMPEDVPLESHDEPPGSSHHHGASGTRMPDHGHHHH